MMGMGTKDWGIIFGGDGMGEGATMFMFLGDMLVAERKKREVIK